MFTLAPALVAASGISKDNVAAAVAAAKLPPAPDASNAAPMAGSNVRWFSYTDAQNYSYRQFKATAAQSTGVFLLRQRRLCDGRPAGRHRRQALQRRRL